MSSAYAQAVQLRTRDKFAVGTPIYPALRALMQNTAIIQLGSVGSGVLPAFTDNSTGTAGAAFESMPVPTAPVDTTANAVATGAVVGVDGASGVYAPGNVLTASGDTGTEPTFTVTHTRVHSAAIAAGGSGGTNGAAVVTGTTGTGTKFQANVTITGGAISAVNSIQDGGDYTVNPTTPTAEPVTGAGLAGATLNLVMGVKNVSLLTAGSVSVVGGEPHSTTGGGGAGCTLGISWTAGVSKTNFDDGITKGNNALAVVAESLNDYFAVLGLPATTYGGTVATPDTIPAMDTTVNAITPANPNATAVDYTTGVAAMVHSRNNMATAIRALNFLLVAVGQSPIADPTGGRPSNSNLPVENALETMSKPPYGAPNNAQKDPTAPLAMTTPAATVAGTGTPAGSTSVSQSAYNTFLKAFADNVAFLAATVNTLRTSIDNKTLPLVGVTVD